MKNHIGDLITHPKLGPGTYRVTATAMTGGGTGHGPHDIFPNGHQLTLMPEQDGVIDWKAEPKRFYQSGCFVDSMMLPYCQPLESVIAQPLPPFPPLPPGFSRWIYRGVKWASGTAVMNTSFDEIMDDGSWDPPAMFQTMGHDHTHYLEAVIDHHFICKCQQCRDTRDARNRTSESQ